VHFSLRNLWKLLLENVLQAGQGLDEKTFLPFSAEETEHSERLIGGLFAKFLQPAACAVCVYI